VTALVTTDEARTYLGVGKEDAPTDTLLSQIIDGLSLRVIQFTGRTYINPDANDKATSREYSFDPSERELEIDTCRGLSKVEASASPKDANAWEEVDPELWLAEPLGSAVVERLRFLTADVLPAVGTGWSALALHTGSMAERSPWPHQTRSELATRTAIRVTAKWGLGPDSSTVPANVKLALVMWLQNIHKRDQAFFGESAKVIAKLAMPEDVKELLVGEAGVGSGAFAV
jgi:hypothetical protein